MRLLRPINAISLRQNPKAPHRNLLRGFFVILASIKKIPRFTQQPAATGFQPKTLARIATNNDLLNQLLRTRNQLFRKNAVIIASNY